MTDTLYRAVKFSDRQPTDKKIEGGTLSANGPYFCNMLDNVVALCQWRNGKFYTIEEVDGKIIENETKEVIEWLEPIPSPGDNQSLEPLEVLNNHKLISNRNEGHPYVHAHVDLVVEAMKDFARSRPSIDIVDELRKANPYGPIDSMPWETSGFEGWDKAADKVKELLTQQK